MNTPRDLRRRVEDITDALVQQYGREPYCEILHQELDFAQTAMPEDQAQALRDSVASMGITLPDDSLKLTVEHEELHTTLRRIIMDLQSQGADMAQMVALMLVAGRRIGMSEASGLLSSGPDWDDNTFMSKE